MDNEKDFIEAANNSAQHTNSLTLTFLATAVYLGISVASTSDEVLLIGRSVQLPLLNAAISIRSFFSLAPALLVVMHLYLLLQRHLLILILVDDHLETAKADSRLVFPFLLGNVRVPGSTYISPLLEMLFIGIYVVLPIGLLLLIQTTFLPYHSPGVTTWHEFLMLIDLTLLWYFLGAEYLLLTDWEEKHRKRQSEAQAGSQFDFSPLLKVITISVTASVAFVSVYLLVGAGNGGELRLGVLLPDGGVIRRHLDLSGQTLVVQEPPPEIVEAYPSFDQALRRHAKGVHLSGGDLRGADLSNSVLVNADLRGVDLTGANLAEADLRGAILGSIGKGATLRRANLAGANLAGSKLASVDFRFANLRGANLAMSDLSRADLREAQMQKADLRGANLDGSRLDLARLREAKLSGASLEHASLVGADLYLANLTGVSLRDARLLGARLHSAFLFGADFRGAEARGAEFPNAHLEGALGLSLHGLNLRKAYLNGLSSCTLGQSVANPTIVDFRGVRLDPKRDWDALRNTMEIVLKQVAEAAGVNPDSPPAAALRNALKRIENAGKQKTCLGMGRDIRSPGGRGSKIGMGLLYFPGEIGSDLSWWPKPVDENQFQFALAGLLKNQVCSKQNPNPNLARSLVRKMANCYLPANASPPTITARMLLAEIEKPWREICLGLRPLQFKYRDTIRQVADDRQGFDFPSEVCK